MTFIFCKLTVCIRLHHLHYQQEKQQLQHKYCTIIKYSCFYINKEIVTNVSFKSITSKWIHCHALHSFILRYQYYDCQYTLHLFGDSEYPDSVVSARLDTLQSDTVLAPSSGGVWLFWPVLVTTDLESIPVKVSQKACIKRTDQRNQRSYCRIAIYMYMFM